MTVDSSRYKQDIHDGEDDSTGCSGDFVHDTCTFSSEVITNISQNTNLLYITMW